MDASFGTIPSNISMALKANETELIRAINKLGPGRVSWAGTATRSEANQFRDGDRNWTCWYLDGKRASYKDIYEAAGVRPKWSR